MHIMNTLAELFSFVGIPKVSMIDGLKVITDARIPLKIRKKIHRGRYEKSEREALSKIITADDRILEIGCGVGVVAMICERLCPGRCIHYEPNPEVRSLILENFEMNGLRCSLVSKAITANGGPVVFHVADNIWSSSLIDRDLQRTITVESQAIDEAVSGFSPTVVVIDAEGAELEIIEAGAFVGVRCLIVEVHIMLIGALGVERIKTRLKSLGFTEISESDGRTMQTLTFSRAASRHA